MRSIYLLFLLLPAVNLQAQVYKGTIDKYPVVFEMTRENPDEFNARYYYTRVKTNIFLKADEKEKMVFYSISEENNKETFRLKKEGKALKGTWTKNGKKLAVNLAQVDTAKVKSNYRTKRLDALKKEDLFTWLKLEQIKFDKNNEETTDGAVLEWYTEPVSKTSFFRIKSSDRIKNIAGVNRLLREIHLDEIITTVTCGSSAVLGGDYQFTGKLAFLSPQILAVYCVAGYYCGGAHPDFNKNGVVIDCQTLKPVKLEDLYDFGEDFETTWRDIVKAHYPNQMGGENEDDCNYNETDVWSQYDWCLTKDGLYIGAYFPRVMRSCDTDLGWPIIPYKDLVKYRAKKSKYTLE